MVIFYILVSGVEKQPAHFLCGIVLLFLICPFHPEIHGFPDMRDVSHAPSVADDAIGIMLWRPEIQQHLANGFKAFVGEAIADLVEEHMQRNQPAGIKIGNNTVRISFLGDRRVAACPTSS